MYHKMIEKEEIHIICNKNIMLMVQIYVKRMKRPAIWVVQVNLKTSIELMKKNTRKTKHVH